MNCWKVFAFATFCVTVVSPSCPKECHCPSGGPRCAAGVSVVQDGCRCCKVCARQLFEDCGKLQPCDRAKGLECNYGGMRDAVKGICRAKSDGRSCEYNNKIHQNGENFRPNCKHQCTCMDGAVGCVSLCPHVVILPMLGCMNPKRVKVPGGCCDQLVCAEETLVVKKHMEKKKKDSSESENELAEGSKLRPGWRGSSRSLPAFRSHPVDHALMDGAQCESQATAWSPCSKSCGTGVSTRLTSSNSQCKLVKETRICLIRPCSQTNRHESRQKCSHTEKAQRPVKLSHAGCRSLRRFRPKYCGSCSEGRCCEPQATHTMPLRFQCADGKITSRMVMMIDTCRCKRRCPRGNHQAAAFHRLLKDNRNIGI